MAKKKKEILVLELTQTIGQPLPPRLEGWPKPMEGRRKVRVVRRTVQDVFVAPAGPLREEPLYARHESFTVIFKGSKTAFEVWKKNHSIDPQRDAIEVLDSPRP